MHTYIILSLCLSLGYVTAQDPGCDPVSAVYLDSKTVPAISDTYKFVGEEKNGYPVYKSRDYNIHVEDGKIGIFCELCEIAGPLYFLDPLRNAPNTTCFTDETSFYNLDTKDGIFEETVSLQGTSPNPSDLQECAESVNVSPSGMSTPSDLISGDYERTSNSTPPQYTNNGRGATISLSDGTISFMAIIMAIEQTIVYFSASYKTCFPKCLNQKFNVSGQYAEQVVSVTLTTPCSSGPYLPNQCPECKQVLDGPLPNFYTLQSENDPRCEDRCLYSNPEGREFCFVAGPDQVLLECPDV